MSHIPKYLPRILPRILLAIFSLLLSTKTLHADEAAERAQDAAQMKRIWEALMAYKKANGKLPDQLGELIPKFLPNPKDLISPRDPRDTSDVSREEKKHFSSYDYEWGSRPFHGITFTEAKTYQLEEYGSVVPLLRCNLYERTLSITHAGDFFASEDQWQNSGPVQTLIAERGLGPGLSIGKFLEVTVVDSNGAPLDDVKVKVQGRVVKGVGMPARILATGKDGRVRIPFGPVESMQGLLSFEKPGYFTFYQDVWKGSFPDSLRVTAHRTKSISGFVTDPTGKPLAKAIVRFARESGGEELPENWRDRLRINMDGATVRIGASRTEPDGKWEIDRFPDQPDLKIKCLVSHPDHAVKILTLDWAALERDGYFSGKARLTLEEPFRIRGKVTMPDGKPAVNAQIRCMLSADPDSPSDGVKRIEMTSNAEGEFEFRERVPGYAKIAILPKSGAAPTLREVKISPEAPPLTIALDAGRVLKGKVVNRRNQPIAGVSILFTGWEQMDELTTHPVIATSDAEGNWQWERAPLDPVEGSAILPSGKLYFWRENQRGIINLIVRPEDEHGTGEK